MEQKARITLEEISNQIGISRTTIYKVLNNTGKVSDETREQVEAALKKFHYVQNRNARNLAMNRDYKIGYVGFRSRSAEYFSAEVRKGLDKAVKEFGDDGLKLLIEEFEVEAPKHQEEAVEAMLQKGVRHFVLAYSSRTVIQSILLKLQRENCEVVLLSRDVQVPEDTFGNHYVGVDYYRSGALAAELLQKMMPSGGAIYVPVSREYKTNQDILTRLQGFTDTIKLYPNVRVLPIAYGITTESDIRSALADVLDGKEDVRGIFDLTYRLDIEADILRERGRQDIRLVGFDLFPEIRRYVSDGTIDALVYQDISSQAYFAVKLLFEQLCYGRRRERQKHYSKLEIIMKENLQYF